MADDWYRNNNWSKEIEEKFFGKLARARSQRDQYQVIQALTLSGNHPEVCLKLVDHYFETRKDKYEDVRALLARKDAYETQGNIGATISSYHAILKREEEFPKHSTTSYVDFPYWVSVNVIVSEYKFALEILSKSYERLTFPLDYFKWYSSKAIIEKRKDYAEKALEVAQVKKSGFRFHQNLGLVGKEHHGTIKKLFKIKT